MRESQGIKWNVCSLHALAGKSTVSWGFRRELLVECLLQGVNGNAWKLKICTVKKDQCLTLINDVFILTKKLVA